MPEVFSPVTPIIRHSSGTETVISRLKKRYDLDPSPHGCCSQLYARTWLGFPLDVRVCVFILTYIHTSLHEEGLKKSTN